MVLGSAQTWAVNSTRTLTVSGAVSGVSGSTLTKTGAGSLILNGNNSYHGGTIISNGTLAANNNNALGDGLLTMAGGALTNTTGNTLNNNINLSAPTGYIGVATSKTLVLGGSITNTGMLLKDGAGTLTLSGANSYGGGTTISGGSLAITGSGTLGNTNGAFNLAGNSVKMDLGGTTQYVGPAKIQINNAGGFSNGTLVATSYTLAVGTVDAVLAGNGIATKAGGNPIILNAANTYTNETRIGAGKLSVNGSVLSSLITVNSTLVSTNAVLAGTGTVQAVTVNAGGLLTAGDLGVTGTLTFNGAVTLSAGSTNTMEIYTAGFDILKGNGANTLTMNGTTVFDFTGNASATNGAKFALFQNWGSIVTNGATYTAIGLGTDGVGHALDVSVGTNGYVTVIPEPASAAMIIIGAAVGLAVHRARRSAMRR